VKELTNDSKPPLSYLTLAGTVHGQAPRYNAEQRAKAAAAAGIGAIGVRWDEPLGDAASWVQIAEAEWVELTRPVAAELTAGLERLAAAGCPLVKAGVCGVTTRREAANALISLVTCARRQSMTVAVEPVAWGCFPSLRDVLDVIALAGFEDSPDVGICYDLWQVAMGTAHKEWFCVPARQIAKVEVSGIGFSPAGETADMAMDRPLLAVSAVNVPLWLDRLTSTGFAGPVTYEQPNCWLRSLPLADMAAAAVRDCAEADEPNWTLT
jgi:sugar phosphate isomerase/epimerase